MRLPPLVALLAVLGAGQAFAGPGTPPTLRLPDGARPTRYELDLTVLPTEATFRGEIRISVALAEPTTLLWLNATELTVLSASVEASGQTSIARPVPGGEDFLGFAFDHPVGPGPAVLTVSYQGPIDETRSRGLYRVREADGEWYAYTFFEPVDARRVMPCFDEPTAKVPWKLRLRVRRGDVALANAPVESERDEDAGMKLVTFAESRPLPSYLVAFVVGPFDLVDSGTAGRHGTPLRFVVPRGRREELRYAREVTPRVVGLLEDYFGMPYPFVKLDVAVVPRYWGTMEHPGLVAMGQPLSLIRPAEESVGRRKSYANILTHELAHYWFGDYVTCAWWDDTWLNEALGEWLDGKLTDRLEPSWRHLALAQRLASSAKETDALGTAKRIRQPVENRSDIEGSFDNSITYFKGAAVLRMFESWLGEDTFRAAIRRYLSAHAWGNATTADFFAALDAEAGRDVSGPLRSFVDQPGLPLVSASLDCAGRKPRLKLRQDRFLALAAGATGTERWRVPLCVRWAVGTGVGRACTLLDSREQEMEIDAPACPAWIVVNEGGAGYYRVAYDDGMRHRLSVEAAKGGGSSLTPAERMAFQDDLAALVGVGRLPVAAAFETLPSFLADPDPLVVYEALDTLDLVRPDRLPDGLRPSYARAVRQLLGARASALGWDPGDDPPDLRQLRQRLVPLVATYGEDPLLRSEGRRRALGWLEDRRSADPDLTWGLLAVAAFDGDRSVYDRLLAEARRTSDRQEQSKLLWALGSFRDPAISTQALGLILHDEFDVRESLGILWGAASHRETQDAAWAFVRESFDRLAARMRGDETSGLISGVVSRFCDEDRRREAAAFFQARSASIDGAPLALANALETVDVCIAEERRNAAGIAEFLKQY